MCCDAFHYRLLLLADVLTVTCHKTSHLFLAGDFIIDSSSDSTGQDTSTDSSEAKKLCQSIGAELPPPRFQDCLSQFPFPKKRHVPVFYFQEGRTAKSIHDFGVVVDASVVRHFLPVCFKGKPLQVLAKSRAWCMQQ